MTLSGTVVNGSIVLDGDASLPEGARVWVELADAGERCPALEPGTREEELAILRQSIADAKAGRTRPLEEVMADIAARHGLPTPDGE